ncbi:endonuclease III [Fusobacterium sp. MFO224]|uniref:endonuclease III n=1 Tax=Fusobacterium sp. MFO224 TaxID=3378070 RepID=UPI0038542EC5
MTKKIQDKVKMILFILEKKFGNPKCALNYETPFELLIAVMLSAQCTDKRVNIVTSKMFKEINTPEQFSQLNLEEIEEKIKSTGFYRNKSKNIKKTSKQLLEDYGGKVPKEMGELLKLSGVGRKTANVVRGEIWGLADGITVDTHVKRLSRMIGLTKEEKPEKIEKDLMKIVPKDKWIEFSHLLILQGRDKCIARRPKCSECEINSVCETYKNIKNNS